MAFANANALGNIGTISFFVCRDRTRLAVFHRPSPVTGRKNGCLSLGMKGSHLIAPWRR
jgi:hypothetical protein